jgi:hypothetical protein
MNFKLGIVRKFGSCEYIFRFLYILLSLDAFVSVDYIHKFYTLLLTLFQNMNYIRQTHVWLTKGFQQ